MVQSDDDDELTHVDLRLAFDPRQPFFHGVKTRASTSDGSSTTSHESARSLSKLGNVVIVLARLLKIIEAGRLEFGLQTQKLDDGDLCTLIRCGQVTCLRFPHKQRQPGKRS